MMGPAPATGTVAKDGNHLAGRVAQDEGNPGQAAAALPDSRIAIAAFGLLTAQPEHATSSPAQPRQPAETTQPRTLNAAKFFEVGRFVVRGIDQYHSRSEGSGSPPRIARAREV